MIAEHQLREIPLLNELESEELLRLAKVMKERRAPKGSYLVYFEDPGPSILFLTQGRAKVTLISNEGKEIVLYTLSEGDFFGEIAVLTGEDRSANVVATTDCRLFVLNGDDFRQHIKENNGLALAMMKELALRLRTASGKIGDLALFDVYRRVARTLKSMALSKVVDGEEVMVIEERPTHQELANMVGTSREMVTRALKGLEEDGCIVIQSKCIEVRKMPL
jgi:CRP/FNR family cyclic AMP-dependent transcriptional regulator